MPVGVPGATDSLLANDRVLQPAKTRQVANKAMKGFLTPALYSISFSPFLISPEPITPPDPPGVFQAWILLPAIPAPEYHNTPSCARSRLAGSYGPSGFLL